MLAAAVTLLSASALQHADAAVVVSSGTTQNMTCSGGVCAPTAANAVLNAGDLENLLASGNVEITTTGAGVQAKDIDVKAPFGWSSGSALALDASKSIAIDKAVSVSGTAAVSLTTGKKGTLSFGGKGNVTFASLSSSLTINGAAYTLTDSIKSLASAIASNPSGDYALAASYDASQDGIYTSSPIPTTFAGSFEGLGNAISNFSMGASYDTNEGFFAELGASGTIANFGLLNANVGSSVRRATLGAMVGSSDGTITNSYATGNLVDAQADTLGGMVGQNNGTMARCHAAVAIAHTIASAGGLVGYSVGPVSSSSATGDVQSRGTAGGLIGENDAAITDSFATGAVTGEFAGGLVGLNYGPIADSYSSGNVSTRNRRGASGGLVGAAGGAISNSYATGDIRGVTGAWVGGLVGANDAAISDSYSTGAPSGGSYTGGLIGYDETEAGSLSDTYWDTTTSGITDLSQGAGNIANDPGITGLSTQELQSGLPTGFEPTIWSENGDIDDGLPYLLALPPKRR